MNLLYLAFVRLPTEKAHGVQIMKTCEAFVAAGVKVELMIPGRRTHIQKDPFEYYDVQKSFKLTSLNTPDWVEKWRVFGFILSALWFSEAAKWLGSFWEADIIYSRDAFLLFQYIFLGRRLVYEAHVKPTAISTFVAKRSYRLVVISEGLREAYVSAGIDSGKIIVAHDAVDSKPFEKNYNQKESRDWLGIPKDKKIALYVGRIDASKGADTFTAASEHALNEWLCVLIGSGPLKDELQKRYPKALFLPETPYSDLPRVLSSADIFVLPNSAKDETFAEYTSPLKAFAYIAARKPIISSDVPALRAIFGSEVKYFKADDPESLAETLSAPVHTPSLSAYSWRDRTQYILDNIL